MPRAATWVDLETIISSEVSQTNKILYDITHMWNLKNVIQMNLFTKEKQTCRCIKQTWLPKGNMGRDKLRIWV